MKNIKVLGNGFVASHLLYDKILERLKPEEKQISELIDQYKPDVLVNCIAFCGSPNIDQCEIEKEKTLETNTIIPMIVANVCKKKGIHLVHLGSGCIFYDKSPHAHLTANTDVGTNQRYVKVYDPGWKETDFANPKSFYSRTKYSADLALEKYDNVSILRLRMPLSSSKSTRNLISKLINYKQIVETENSITWIDDLVLAIDHSIKNKLTGIYNIASEIPVRHSQIMEEYCKYFPDHRYELISPKELEKLVAATRSNCILDVNKAKKAGFRLTDSKIVIEQCIKGYVG
jgi:dTDP-4-dehydrorhamnose reductase